MTTTASGCARLTRFVAGLAAVSVASLSGCGEDESTGNTDPPTVITLGRYTIEPAELTVTPGEHSLQVTNVDTMEHNLVVAGRGTRNLAPGETQLITIDVVAGDYRMWCDVPGHAGMGQYGTLQVGDVSTTPELPPSPT